MEQKYYKAINFDLSTHQLEEHYPGANYRQAYEDLKRFFRRHDFSHRQGSGYISDEKLSTADIYDLMDDLSQQYQWIGECVNKIDVTNVGVQHDLTDFYTVVSFCYTCLKVWKLRCILPKVSTTR